MYNVHVHENYLLLVVRVWGLLEVWRGEAGRVVTLVRGVRHAGEHVLHVGRRGRV